MPDTGLRIAFVLPSLAPGGAERVVISLASALADGIGPKPAEFPDLSVDLILFDGNGPLSKRISAKVAVHDLRTRTLRRSLVPLTRLIRETRPQFVVSSMLHVNLPLLALRPLLPSGTALIVREANLPSKSLARLERPLLWRTGMRALYRTATRVVSSSRRMADELGGDFGIAANRLFLLQNPVDEQRLRTVADPPARSLGPGRRFISAGRLVPQKGFDRLIELAQHLDPVDEILVFGDGPDADTLRSAAAVAPGGASISFAGYADDLPRWLAGADAFLLPSRFEGMPNAALDALVCGTPVIATPESGGIAELAAAAPANAVRVVAIDGGFLQEMQRVTPDPSLKFRGSLLPKIYRLENSVAAFRDMVAELLNHQQSR